MVKQISRKTKSVKKHLLKIKQETDWNRQPHFKCFWQNQMEGKLKFLPRPLRKKRKINYGVVHSFLPRSLRHGRLGPRSLLCPAGPKLIPPLKGTLKCLGDPIPAPPTETIPFPTRYLNIHWLERLWTLTVIEGTWSPVPSPMNI